MLTSVALGLALGATDSAVNHVAVWRDETGLARSGRTPLTQAAEFLSFLLDTGWAWAALAVLAGWLVARRRGGGITVPALAGCVALAAATVADYGLNALFDDAALQVPATTFWLSRSVVLGPILGAAGALTRRPDLVGILTGLLVPWARS